MRVALCARNGMPVLIPALIIQLFNTAEACDASHFAQAIQDVFRISSTAPVNRFHVSVSASNFFRPVAVSL